MRAIFCLFDSLNRLALGCYSGRAVHTPNFDRFAERAVRFDNHYVGSLPCMPARRDLHTGRLNFMHRSWGPLEPFDNSCPELLRQAGVYTHLVTDHLHYFEDGGATYHNRYNSWEFIRGQENDPWKAMVEPPLKRFREHYAERHYMFNPDQGVINPHRLHHAINRESMRSEEDMPGPRCYRAGLEFLEVNHRADNWFLQIECFDPHEPFFAPERFKAWYRTGWNGGILDWPNYEKVADSPEEVAEIRANYAALVSMCDHYFGKLLDFMDEHAMWQDTALILSTDHGFLLAEHDWWGKNLQPYYREISHIPLLIHNPLSSGCESRSRSVEALTQTHDLMPTLLDLFNAAVPMETQGQSVLPLIDDRSRKHRETGIFGMFGGPIGATDSRYSYYLYPDDLYAPGLNEYTLMPMHIRSLFSAAEIQSAELTEPFSFSKQMPLLKINALRDARRIPNVDGRVFENPGTCLYDLDSDPEQNTPIKDQQIEQRLRDAIVDQLQKHDCPAEMFDRLALKRR